MASFDRRQNRKSPLTYPWPTLSSGPFARNCELIKRNCPSGGKGGAVRTWTTFLAFGLAMAVVSPAMAQTAKGFGGVNPTSIVQQPITTSPFNTSISAIPLYNHSIKLSDFFPSIGSFSNKPTFGRSNYPSQDDMPGLNYLKAFGYFRPQPAK
jgi:hypothetical protein